MTRKTEKEVFQEKIGRHIVKLREQKGLTSAELGRACDMERSNISRLEKGRMNPSLYLIKQVCNGLEISVRDFFRDFD